MVGSLAAQDFANYTPLEAKGPIPDDILKRSSDKFEELRSNLVKDESSDHDRQEAFYLETSFVVDQTLRSGDILFNDTLTNYVRKVADITLENRPELRKKLSFFIINTPVSNAFASGNGYIFLSMGMLASLDNEAELAYLICHEAVHYLRSHQMKSFFFTKQLDEKEGLFNKEKSLEQKLLERSRYSTGQEVMADTLGADLYLETGYDTSAIRTLLAKSGEFDIPFQPSVKFSPYLFENPHFIFGKAQMLRSPVPVEKLEGDTLLTHPPVDERMDYMDTYLGAQDAIDAGQQYRAGADEFRYINRVARYELVRTNLKFGSYDRALYTIVNLQDHYGSGPYLDKLMAQCWYYISMYKFLGEYGNMVPEVASVHPEMQWYTHLTRHTGKLRSITLALHYLVQLPPGDPAVEQMINHLFYASAITLDKLRNQAGDRFNFREAFHTILQEDPKLAGQFRRIQEIVGEKREELKEMNLWTFIETYLDFSTPPLDTLLVVEPYYMKFDVRNDFEVSYLDQEQRLEDMLTQIKRMAGELDMTVDVLSINELGTGDVEQYNQVRFLKSYLVDKMNYFPYNLVAVDYERVRAICDDLGFSTIAMTGALSIKDKHRKLLPTLAGSLLFPPLLPLGLERALTPRDDFFHFMLVYDIETDQLIGESHHWMKQKDNEGTINATLYYNLQKVKYGTRE